jgi:hypothetical protein
VYGDTEVTEVECAMVGVRRYRGNGGGMSDAEYIFGRPRGR